ncbi:MAG: hypothetical protein RIQ93_1122 [Verrucomicrobiota bacterium]|jgi:hypothetical protein
MKTSAPTRSRRLRNSLLALALVGLGSVAWWLVRHPHATNDHPQHDEGTAALTLDNGRRWETDVPLRTGMQRIRDAVDQAFIAQASGRLTPAEAKALWGSVQENVNFLIANCKLAPKADAALHVLITELLAGAAQLAENPAAHEGLARMGQALRHYSDYFDHPGWVAFDAVTAERAQIKGHRTVAESHSVDP